MLTAAANNPFALMINPEAVIRAVECSERLGRLHARICRPLDKPIIPKVDDDLAAYDRQVDNE